MVGVGEWGNRGRRGPTGTKPCEAAPESSGAGRGQAAGGQESGRCGGGVVCGGSHSAEPAGRKEVGKGPPPPPRRSTRCLREGERGATVAPGQEAVRACGGRGLSCGIAIRSLGFPQRGERGGEIQQAAAGFGDVLPICGERPPIRVPQQRMPTPPSAGIQLPAAGPIPLGG